MELCPLNLMEALDMDKAEKSESHLTSVAAFVEGGVQDACDDACSICLDDFSESNPSSITNCRHEYHLQCILEWCQRSSQCPMCCQAIGLKDPICQELLDAVEQERSIRNAPSRNTAIFHHPTLGNFELQHFPVGVNDAELEERIIQQLAAAASMGRSHHLGRRDSQRSRSSANGRPHFLVFSSHPGTSTSSSLSHMAGEDAEPNAISVPRPSPPRSYGGGESPQQVSSARYTNVASGPTITPASRHGLSFNNRRTGNPASPNEDIAGPSDLQSFSDSLKSRLNSVSMRYKESISKSTRGWKERFFSRSSSLSDIGSEVQREVTAGIASVSRLMEHLENRENSRASQARPRSSRSTNSIRELE